MENDAHSIEILLVEDNPGDARLVQEALAEHAPGEFTVTWVDRLADALARIAAGRFDVVVSDLGLPDSRGLATAQAIAVRAHALALVVLTGSHDQDLGREAIQHGAQDYLVKGEASGPVIARTLRYAIERKQLEIGLRTANEALERRVAERTAELETAFMSTVAVATTLGEMRDPYTAGHQRRVAEIAVAIGAELGFDARRQEGLRVAGYLHDVGKITIPSEILAKPGKLSATEFQLIQGHAQAGNDVLKNVEFPWPVAQAALQHHERVDGSGYPQGLNGEAILLEARIMAVADVVEAMSSHRPYRPGLGIDKALAEINRGRGTSYDANVTDACLKLFGEMNYVIR